MLRNCQYQWLNRQQELFVERRFDEMDLHGVQTVVFNSAKLEIEFALGNAVKDILRFFILFDYYPDYQEYIAAGDAIHGGRAEIETVLTRSPSVRDRLEEDFPNVWTSVRDRMRGVFEWNGLSRELIPETSPYVLDALLDVAIFPKNWDMSK